MKLSYRYFLSLLFSHLVLAAPLPEVNSENLSREEPASVCQPISFLENWKARHNSNAYGYPRVLESETLELLPDDLYGGAVAYLNNNKTEPPYEVRFEFKTFDSDGGRDNSKIWHSADGVRFFFLRSEKGYGTPMEGSAMGRSEAKGGYAVDFPIYGYRRMRITDDNGLALTQIFFPKAYTHEEWIPVTVTITADQITVRADGKKLSRKISASTRVTGKSFGFSASTGAADAQHLVRNLCLKKL